MAPRSRAATRSTRTSGESTHQVSRNWRKRTRFISPDITSDSDSESTTSSTSSTPGFQGFMNLPVDVFVNIASYFQPQDVLALSRVNSFLRRLLMSCKAEPIWRSARLNLTGLPPCPEELSEPSYAGRLFSKICTMCGGRALQSMDPNLLERLCRKCKDIELVDITVRAVDPSLVCTSTTILPGYSEDWSRRGPWCFRKDATYVRNKLDELEAAGDQEAKQAWIKRRRDIVGAREKSSKPLKEWLQRLEKEREAELDSRRLARQAEIKSRLRDLGRDERDLDFQNCNECFSFVYNASPLTDKAWKKSLPKLLKTIEANRKERMESEREDRRDEIYDWASDVCEPKVLYRRGGGRCRTRKLDVLEMLLDNLEILPEIKMLLDEDRWDDEFKRDFESQKPKLADLLTNWVNEQEARLVSMMPNDDPTPDFNLPGSESMMEFKTDKDPTPLPMTALSINSQKLLRADAIFMRTPTSIENPGTGSSTCYFYPDFDAPPDEFTYSSTASEIARTFLAPLGCPNASHLEMTSARYALDCGICPEIRSLGWKDLIEHCLKKHWLDEPEQEVVTSKPNSSTTDAVSSDLSDLSSDLSDPPCDSSESGTDSESDQYLEG